MDQSSTSAGSTGAIGLGYIGIPPCVCHCHCPKACHCCCNHGNFYFNYPYNQYHTTCGGTTGPSPSSSPGASATPNNSSQHSAA